MCTVWDKIVFLFLSSHNVKTVTMRPESTDADLAATAAVFPNLEAIGASGCWKITRRGLEALSKLGRLKRVQFTGADNIDVDDVRWFQRARPGCVTVFGRTIDDRVRFLTAAKPTPQRRRGA